MPKPIIQYQFCPQCGKPLTKGEFAKKMYPCCPNCSFVHWGEFSLGVGGIVWHEDKVLLVRRAQNPGKGNWTIPGGYVDQRERIADAIVRELREETGLETSPLSLIALRDRPGDRHDLYLIFLLRHVGGELHPQKEEVSDLGFFTIEECRELPIASLSLSVIEDSRGHLTGFVPKSGVPLIGEKSVLYQYPTPPKF